VTVVALLFFFDFCWCFCYFLPLACFGVFVGKRRWERR
jgi:hypothetical protein